MKKLYFPFLLALIALLSGLDLISNSAGLSSTTRTGSPLSGGLTCASCHSGGANLGQNIQITTDIPPSGFEENTTYNITINANGNGATHPKIGFQASIEGQGVHQGTISENSTRMQMVQGAKFITHTQTGNATTNGNNSWTFQWNSGSAPDSAIIYTSVNFTNGSGNRQGDLGLASTLLLRKAPPAPTCNTHSLSAVAGLSGNYNQRFNWTTITGATGHRLQYRMVGSNSWSGVNEAGTQRLIQNLAPGQYEARVYGINLGDTSCTVNFSIACATDVSYSINIFQAGYLDALPASSARVTVFNVSGGKSLYSFELENLSNGNTTRVDGRRNQTFSQLSGGSYQLRVYDAYNCQASLVSPVTINALDTAYIPNLLSAVNSSPNGFRPLWNRPRQNGTLMPGILSYQLRVRNETDNQLVNLYTGITDTFFHVNNLTPGKLYRFNVRSRYNPGSGAINSAFSIRRDRTLGAGGNKNEQQEGVLNIVRFYPNPTTELLNIESPIGSYIELFDLQGRMLQRLEAQSPTSSLDLSGYASGQYLIEIEYQGQLLHEKVVKQ